jgi:hypothetical protein
MGMRRMLAIMACAIGVVGLGAGSAFAGEITGNGKYIAGSPDAPLHGQSECAFSGLDDPDVDPETGEDDFGRTQSWGQIVRNVKGLGGVPGTACNPVKSAG